MVVGRTCSRCHEMTADRHGPGCGRRADKPGPDCDCPACNRRRRPGRATLSGLLRETFRSFDPGGPVLDCLDRVASAPAGPAGTQRAGAGRGGTRAGARTRPRSRPHPPAARLGRHGPAGPREAVAGVASPRVLDRECGQPLAVPAAEGSPRGSGTGAGAGVGDSRLSKSNPGDPPSRPGARGRNGARSRQRRRSGRRVGRESGKHTVRIRGGAHPSGTGRRCPGTTSTTPGVARVGRGRGGDDLALRHPEPDADVRGEQGRAGA